MSGSNVCLAKICLSDKNLEVTPVTEVFAFMHSIHFATLFCPFNALKSPKVRSLQKRIFRKTVESYQYNFNPTFFVIVRLFSDCSKVSQRV